MTNAEQAADAILALINSRPTSPTREELVAILGKSTRCDAAPDPVPASERMRRLRAAIAATERFIDAAGGYSETDADELAELEQPLIRITEEVWATPARTLADLQERATIARHWHRQKACDIVWTHPSQLDDWSDRTVAELIHAVQQFAGASSVVPVAACPESRKLPARISEQHCATASGRTDRSGQVRHCDQQKVAAQRRPV